MKVSELCSMIQESILARRHSLEDENQKICQFCKNYNQISV